MTNECVACKYDKGEGLIARDLHTCDPKPQATAGWKEEFRKMYYEPWGSLPADKLALMLSFISELLKEKDEEIARLEESIKDANLDKKFNDRN